MFFEVKSKKITQSLPTIIDLLDSIQALKKIIHFIPRVMDVFGSIIAALESTFYILEGYLVAVRRNVTFPRFLTKSQVSLLHKDHNNKNRPLSNFKSFMQNRNILLFYFKSNIKYIHQVIPNSKSKDASSSDNSFQLMHSVQRLATMYIVWK